jgi:hypothetical protein
MTDAEKIIREKLEPGEVLLWCGRPRTRFRWQLANLQPLLLFALLCYAAGEGIVQAADSSRASFFGISALLVWYWVALHGPLIQPLLLTRTYYGISSDRVLVVSGFFVRVAHSLHFDFLMDVTIWEERDGSGVIACGEMRSGPDPPRRWGWGGAGEGRALVLVLRSEARRVYELIIAIGRGEREALRERVLSGLPRSTAVTAALPAPKDDGLCGPDEIVRAEMAPTEQLCWTGRPSTGRLLAASDLFMVPLGLVLCGLAVWLFVLVVTTTQFQGWKGFGGVLCLLGGIRFAVLQRVIDARVRRRTCYGLSSERMIVMVDTSPRVTQSLYLDAIRDLALKERRDGSGTIFLDSRRGDYGWLGGRGWPDASGGYPAATLELPAPARPIYDLIRANSQKLQQWSGECCQTRPAKDDC